MFAIFDNIVYRTFSNSLFWFFSMLFIVCIARFSFVLYYSTHRIRIQSSFTCLFTHLDQTYSSQGLRDSVRAISGTELSAWHSRYLVRVWWMVRWNDREMNDKNLLLSRNNCFEYTISLAFISVPTVRRDFSDMAFLTLELNFYILQLQYQGLENCLNLYVRFFYMFKIWGVEGLLHKIQSESGGHLGSYL